MGMNTLALTAVSTRNAYFCKHVMMSIRTVAIIGGNMVALRLPRR